MLLLVCVTVRIPASNPGLMDCFQGFKETMPPAVSPPVELLAPVRPTKAHNPKGPAWAICWHPSTIKRVSRPAA